MAAARAAASRDSAEVGTAGKYHGTRYDAAGSCASENKPGATCGRARGESVFNLPVQGEVMRKKPPVCPAVFAVWVGLVRPVTTAENGPAALVAASTE